MSVDYRYFRVTSGVLASRAAEVQTARAAAAQAIDAFVIEIGATAYYTASFNGELCGFTFASVDRLVWKESKNGFWPKQNLAAGRAMTRRIKALPALTPLATALDCVGLNYKRPSLLGDGKCWFPSITGCAERGIWFVSVPWIFNTESVKVHWTPPADWTEIKLWEVTREIEEIHAARRVPAVQA